MFSAVSTEEESLVVSNSANMLIYSAVKTSEDVYKLNTSLGSFFLRTVYLNDDISALENNTKGAPVFIKASDLKKEEQTEKKQSKHNTSALLDFDSIEANTQLDEELTSKILEAALAYSAEFAAVSYLERSEYSSELLKRKLKQKGHSPNVIQKALDYVQFRGWLSNERYAGAFLRNRSISRCEGRSRLLAELQHRGINREIAEKALDEFFEQKSETQLLAKAVAKLKKRGKTPEQIQQSLIRLGFSWNDIRQYFRDNC